MATTASLKQELATRGDQTPTAGPTIYDLIEAQKDEIARALPGVMSPDRFARIAFTTIRQTPKLLACTPASLIGALMLASQVGLEPGPQGLSYLVPRWSKKAQANEAQFMLGYRGIIELARRSGRILEIEAREVREHDGFWYEHGTESYLRHLPHEHVGLGGDRGQPVAYYGYAKFAEGGHFFEVLDLDQIHRRAKRSQSFDNGPWQTDFGSMARKTCIRAMEPFLPLSAEDRNVLAHDETVVTEIAPNLIDRQPTHPEPDDDPADLPGEDVPDDDLDDVDPHGDCPACGGPLLEQECRRYQGDVVHVGCIPPEDR